jgi:hypothetical protein
MQAEQATFHLPVVAHWGNTVLKPGDYKMSSPDSLIGTHEFKIEGEGRTIYAHPVVADPCQTSNSSHLQLKEIDGEYFVQGFSSGLTGREFTFYTPKRVRHLEAAKSPATGDQSVAVSGN